MAAPGMVIWAAPVMASLAAPARLISGFYVASLAAPGMVILAAPVMASLAAPRLDSYPGPRQFDRNGLCLLYKRFHEARFELPAAANGQRVLHVDAVALATLLAGVAHSPRSRAEKRSQRQ